MGRRTAKSHTLPSSPTHSSSSSDFEFTISISPRKSSAAAANLCPADDLFYKGQLLPLHLSPRLSMVRTLLLASSSTSSSSDATTTASRDSSGSSTDYDSSRPSSAAEDDEFKRLHLRPQISPQNIKKTRYFSLSRFSSVFRKEPKPRDPEGSSAKRVSTTAKDVIRKYLKKVKPLYEKLSQKQQQKMGNSSNTVGSIRAIQNERKDNNGGISYSFSGNLRYPRRRSCVSSCPSSMRSSPSHSGILSRNGPTTTTNNVRGTTYANNSSMEELQSAIQGAIAHCKNSMIQKQEYGQ